MRTGLIARKVGSSRVFTDDGGHIPVTLLEVMACQVVAHRTRERDGYDALQLGVGAAKPNRLTKAERGHFAKAKVEPKAKLAEFRISEDAFVDVGTELSVEHFVAGQRVDVSGVSIGKGFAGAMKRHNFSGLLASHGISVSHRSHGSTGQSQDPGKVFKGKKMAGHMGSASVTTQNLEVVSVDSETGLILVRGAVPGANGGWVRITDSVKIAAPEGLPFPAAISGGAKAAAEAEAPAAETEPEPESGDDAEA